MFVRANFALLVFYTKKDLYRFSKTDLDCNILTLLTSSYFPLSYIGRRISFLQIGQLKGLRASWIRRFLSFLFFKWLEDYHIVQKHTQIKSYTPYIGIGVGMPFSEFFS